MANTEPVPDARLLSRAERRRAAREIVKGTAHTLDPAEQAQLESASLQQAAMSFERRNAILTAALEDYIGMTNQLKQTLEVVAGEREEARAERDEAYQELSDIYAEHPDLVPEEEPALSSVGDPPEDAYGDEYK